MNEETKRNLQRFQKGRSIIEIPESFVVFDLETTGLDSRVDEIIEIGALKVVENKVVDSFEMLVKPTVLIPPFITNLTGITNAMVSDAPSIEEVLPKFLRFIGSAILVGHNVNFDINFIYDASLKIFNQPLQNDFVDTLRLSRKLLKNLYHHKLGEIAHYYGMDTFGSHRSLKDVEMTLAVFYKLQEEILNQYGSFAAFSGSFSYVSTNARDIVPNSPIPNTKNLFYQKHVVITGTLEKMTRKEAMQYLCNLGAFLENQVTVKTDYLIVGTGRGKTCKSTKLRMAENLQKSGFGIQIISDVLFYKELNRIKLERKKISVI